MSTDTQAWREQGQATLLGEVVRGLGDADMAAVRNVGYRIHWLDLPVLRAALRLQGVDTATLRKARLALADLDLGALDRFQDARRKIQDLDATHFQAFMRDPRATSNLRQMRKEVDLDVPALTALRVELLAAQPTDTPLSAGAIEAPPGRPVGA